MVGDARGDEEELTKAGLGVERELERDGRG